MTEVMNFFQTVITFKNDKSSNLSAAEIELAIALKAEALELAAVADEEMRNAGTTQILSSEAETLEKSRIFAGIAVWHNNRAAEKYGKAADRFEEAGRIYRKKNRAFKGHAETMRRLAAQANDAAVTLTDSLKQN